LPMHPIDFNIFARRSLQTYLWGQVRPDVGFPTRSPFQFLETGLKPFCFCSYILILHFYTYTHILLIQHSFLTNLSFQALNVVSSRPREPSMHIAGYSIQTSFISFNLTTFYSSCSVFVSKDPRQSVAEYPSNLCICMPHFRCRVLSNLYPLAWFSGVVPSDVRMDSRASRLELRKPETRRA
jgi:hypothetical protein